MKKIDIKKIELSVLWCFVWFFGVACLLCFIFFYAEPQKPIPANCRSGKGFGQMIYDANCLSCKRYEKILIAPKGKGMYCCPNSSNSVAWNGEAYQCCQHGMVATVVPERNDSICCPEGTKRAFWNRKKGMLFYTCDPDE